MPSPQQEIFTSIRGICTTLGYTVYDYLPPDGVAYPFVFVGEQYSSDQPNKSAIFGVVNQTVHIYNNDYKKRGTTTAMMDNIKTELRKLKETPHFHLGIRSINDQVLTDNSTATPLLHGVIEIALQFN